jgi:hypothetical protein
VGESDIPVHHTPPHLEDLVADAYRHNPDVTVQQIISGRALMVDGEPLNKPAGTLHPSLSDPRRVQVCLQVHLCVPCAML